MKRFVKTTIYVRFLSFLRTNFSKDFMMKKLVAVLSFFLILSCTKESKKLNLDTYRVTLEVQDNRELPFILKLVDENKAEIYNAEEVIEVDEITYRNDSIYIKAPVFEGYIAAKISENGFKGQFIKESLDRYVPIKATVDSIRFKTGRFPSENLEGIWEVVFSPNGPEDTYIAKGIFTQKGHKITGTFRTTTGDYRYLEGVINRNQFKLSTFDGAHAFLFTGSVKGDKLEGIFYSGNHWKEPFIGKRNADYELPKDDTLTFLKEGYDSFNFSFPNEKGELISFPSKEFENKVTVVQIMGSWCPNCLDESKYLTSFTKKQPDVKIVSLAFEISKTKELAFKRIDRLRKRVGIPYPILLAQFGGSDKLLANKKLPMLNHVLSYPTTIIIDKKGKVRKIQTGFNGPATGNKYLEFKTEFESFIDALLKE